MGKNTMMKRSIRLFCERTGNEEWPGLVDSLVGNVGLIFTKGDLNDVSGWLFASSLGRDFYVASKGYFQQTSVLIVAATVLTQARPAVSLLPLY